MTTKVGGAYIEIRADDKNLKGDLDKAHRQVSSSANAMQSSVSRAFTAMSVAAVASMAAISVGIYKVISAANEQEKVVQRLEAVLKASNNAIGYNIKELENMASAMQTVTTVGDEMILGSMAVLATFKNVKEEAFERTTMAALDMAEVMQQDVKSAMVMIAKAMNDPIANLSAMSRAGVQFTQVQKDMIKQLWESGDQISAQNILLDELESQFGGAAKAARDTFGGALRAAFNALGDVHEQIGFVITKNDKLIGLVKETEQAFIQAGEAVGLWVEANDELIIQKTHESVILIKDSVSELVAILKNFYDAAVKIKSVRDDVLNFLIKFGLIMDPAKIEAYVNQFKELSVTAEVVTNSINSTTEGFDRYDKKGKEAVDTVDEVIVVTKKLNEYFQGQAHEISLATHAIREYEAAQAQIIQKTPYQSWLEIDRDTVEVDIEQFYSDWVANHEAALDAQTSATEDALTDQEEAHQHMYDNVHDIAAGFFEDILDGNANMLDSLYSLFKKTLAQIAADLATPLILNIVQGMTGGLGSSLLGGGSGSSLLGNSGSLLSKLFGGGSNPISNITNGFGATGQGLYADLFGVNSIFTNPTGVTGALGGSYGPTAGMAGGNVGLPAADGALAANGLLGGIISTGVFAAGAMIISEVFKNWGVRDPQFGFAGSSLQGWEHNNSDRDLGRYTTIDSGPERYASQNYDYSVFASDFEGNGQNEEIRNTLFSYFDNIFASIDDVTESSINDILGEYSHLGSRGWVSEDTDFETAFAGMSKDVFSNLLGGLVASVLPDEGTIDRIVTEIVDSEENTLRELGEQLITNSLSGIDLFDQNNNTLSGIGAQDQRTTDSFINQPVYEDITHQVSAVADIFNTEFFDAILPEGGNEWDAFVRFGGVIQDNADFMEDFNRQMEEFGETSADAFLNIEIITNVLAGVREGLKSIMTIADDNLLLSDMVASWDDLITQMEEAHATIEDLTEAEQGRNLALGSQLTGLTATSLSGIISGTGDFTGFMEDLSNEILTREFAESLFNDYLYDPLTEVGAAFAETGDALEALTHMTTGQIQDVQNQIDAFNLIDQASASGWVSITGDALNDHLGINQRTDEEVSDVSDIILSMIDSVREISMSSDQLDYQSVARNLEELDGSFTEIGTVLASVQALDTYRGHLGTIGSMKASVYGLEDAFTAGGIGARYGTNLGSSQQQADFVQSLLGLSASEFVSWTEEHGVSVQEASEDVLSLVDIINGTADAFDNMTDSINNTIKSIQGGYGVSGGGKSLSQYLKEFNIATGQASSSDSLTAQKGIETLSSLSGPLLQKALTEAPSAYEYNKIYAKILRTLQGVQDSTEENSGLLDLGSPEDQLSELEGINLGIGQIGTRITNMLSDATFQTYITDFNAAFGDGSDWSSVTAALISLPGVMRGLFPTAEYVNGDGTTTTVGIPGDANLGAVYQPTPTGFDTIDPRYDTLNPIDALSSRYNIDPGELNASLVSGWENSDFAARQALAVHFGVSDNVLHDDFNLLARSLGIQGYADGGISSGPSSGYMAQLHGTEAIIPLGGGSVPLVIQNDNSAGILSELRGLRSELKQANNLNSLKIKKIKQTLDRVTNGGTAFAVESV